MIFYLGTHEPSWLGRISVPLFVSARRLRRLRALPRALGSWALDSGGFSELSLHGRWATSAGVYAAEVDRWSSEIGSLAWAAPQDWMCEPTIRQETGLTVHEHQVRTVDSVGELRGRVRHAHVIPVVQGWTVADYLRCVDLYEHAGIDLTREPVVGVGTVCRRQSTAAGVAILTTLAARGLRLHGFGVKRQGLARAADALVSADSMAWSKAARHRPPLPGCTHKTCYKTCSNCQRWALRWREETMTACSGPVQLDLWRAQRWRDRYDRWVAPGELFRPADHRVELIERTPAAAFVEQHHYSGSYVASRKQIGLFRGTQLVGVAAFSVGVQPRAPRRWCGVAPELCVELGRFVLLDAVAFNAETWLLARALRLLRAELPDVAAVLSYSDPLPRQAHDGRVVMPGHVGQIYQAGNARYLGRSSPRSIWLDPDGQVINRRTLDKVLRGERGHAAAVDELVRLGAPKPRHGEDLRAWLPLALRCGALRQVRHPGCHVYAWALHEDVELAPKQPHPRRA